MNGSAGIWRRAPAHALALLLATASEGCDSTRHGLPSDGTSSEVKSLPAPPPAQAVPLVHLRAQGQLGPGAGTLLIDLAAPRGAKLTLDAPVSLQGSGGIGVVFPSALSGPLGSHSMPLRVPVEIADGATGPVRIELSYFWCTEGNEAACQRERTDLELTLDLSGASPGGEAHVAYAPRSDKT